MEKGGVNNNTNKFTNEEEYIFRSKFGSVPIPKNQNLPDFILEGYEPYTNKVAIIEAVTGKQYTYGELVRDTHRFSRALLALGIRKGRNDVVVVILPNIAEYPIIALGIMSAGGVFSGANPAAHPSEIKKQVEIAEAKLIVTNSTVYEKVRNDLNLPIIVVDDDVDGAVNWSELLSAADKVSIDISLNPVEQTDICALPFSSGTTGVSKGVMLTHRNLVSNLCSTLFGVGDELIGKVTTLGLMPFFHIYGITGICCATIRNKGKVVVMNRYELRTFMDTIIRYEVTFAPIVPPIILQLVKSPIVEEFDLEKVKLEAIMTAAAPLAPELINAFEAKFPQVQVQEAYGLTEHSCVTLTHGRRDQQQAKRNSVGFILPNIEVKFVDPDTHRSLPKNTPGEICVRSPCVMKGYYNNQDETSTTIDKNGWLHTGDIGYIDEDGNLFVIDRIKELIKYKGFQVAPAELEAILLSHPSIEDAAVIPIPYEEAGEIPAGCVVMKKSAIAAQETEIIADEIMAFVGSNVAQYKRIRAIHFVDTIPKSPSGKIMRRVLKDIILEKIKHTQSI